MSKHARESRLAELTEKAGYPELYRAAGTEAKELNDELSRNQAELDETY